MSSTEGSATLRDRLKAEAEARTQEIVEGAAQRIASLSEARIRNAVEQATADLAHQAERMERIASRVSWIGAGTVALAMVAGAIGGAMAVLILRLIG